MGESFHDVLEQREPSHANVPEKVIFQEAMSKYIIHLSNFVYLALCNVSSCVYPPLSIYLYLSLSIYQMNRTVTMGFAHLHTGMHAHTHICIHTCICPYTQTHADM